MRLNLIADAVRGQLPAVSKIKELIAESRKLMAWFCRSMSSRKPLEHATSSPFGELPDPWLHDFLFAYFGEYLHGLLELEHGLVRLSGGVEQVGQIVA